MELKSPQFDTSEVKPTQNELDEEQAARRDFLKKAGTAAAAAPVMGLLVAVDAKPAYAGDRYGCDSYHSLSSDYDGIIQRIVTWIQTNWT